MQITGIIQIAFFGIALFMAAFLLARGDETSSRRWAKIPVRVDESRSRRLPDGEDETDFDLKPVLFLVTAAAIILFVLLLASYP